MDKNALRKKADEIRTDVMQVSLANQAGHIAPSLSCVDILTALYYQVMNYDFSNCYWADRDRLIFSKSHGCYGLYAILCDRGLIPREIWEKFYAADSGLSGCVERNMDYGIEAGCGSLGHGLPLAVGSAFGARLSQQDFHTYCLVGDGELQEGSAWEAIQFAVKHQLTNLTIIIDFNRLQAMDFIDDVLDNEESDLINRLSGFGLEPVTCAGHDAAALAELLTQKPVAEAKRPRVIIAETVKGYGMSCMENIPKFHFRVPACGQFD